jgi:uncharacterized protein (DUF2235 family)
MSSLRRGHETNIGLTYRLLTDDAHGLPMSVYYEPGIQWRGLRRAHEVVAGIGLHRQAKRAYLFLARNWQPGDRIVLMGYSRGAYALRLLAGMIERIGLLRAAQVDEETLERVWRLYSQDPEAAEARALRAARCHDRVAIDFLGAYDTVRDLGLRWPVLRQAVPRPQRLHSCEPMPSAGVLRHALALDETRQVYAPLLWSVDPHRAAAADVVQMWFRGSHGDVGGQLVGHAPSRPLSNIPLVWMLGEAEAAGLPLPALWRTRFVTDADAPAIGTSYGFGRLFVIRRPRDVGLDPSERIHPSARAAATARGIRMPAPSPAAPA